MLDSGKVYKYLDQCAGSFYNVKKILTYNRPWNFITGSRSVGKSTILAIFFVLDYIEYGHKFVYTRRTKDETLYTCETFFGNAIQIINNCTKFNIKSLEYDGGEYFIQMEGEEVKAQCGKIIPLSLEQKHKSNNYSDYFNVVYDEFICEDATKYLGSKATPYREYRSCLSLYQTIDRGIDKPFRNETRFFFLGNTATIYNPIFLSLNISDYIESESKIIAPKNKLWILERIESVEATEDIENSFAYQLAGETERDYAYRNKGYDTSTYIKKLPEIKYYVCTLIKDGVKYGVWKDSNNNFYVGKYHEIGYSIYSLDIQSHDENDLMMITRWIEYPIINLMLDAFKHSRLFFANGKSKNAFLKYFKLMP